MAAIPQGGTYDLTIYQGANFSVTFALRESDGTTVIPLTGYTAKSQIRKRPGDSNLMAEFTCVVNGAAGTVTLVLSDTQTDLLLHNGAYDVFLDNGSVDSLLMQGKVAVDKKVTKEEP